MLILGGREVPGTDWILDGRKVPIRIPADPDDYLPPPIENKTAWWNPDEWGAKPRDPSVEIDLLVGHWTAGEAGFATPADDGGRVVRAMKLRPGIKDLSRRLRVSVHLIIHADGTITQCADPLTTIGIQVGWGAVNARAVGVEIVNAGLGKPNPQRPRPYVRYRVSGKLLRSLAFFPEQLQAWAKLVHVLTSFLPIPRRVPAQRVPGGLSHLESRFTVAQQRAWKGVQEHCHVPRKFSTKVDAGGQLVRTAASLAGCEFAEVR